MLRRSTLILTLMAGLALAPASSALAQSISTQTAPGVNFAGYGTFSWANVQAPAGANPVMAQQIIADIERELTAKGYHKVEEAGDLSLVLTLGAREKTDIQSWGRFGLQTSVYQYTQGQLSLDAFDTKTQQALWHGQASKTINPDKPNPSKASKAVAKLMAKFPARTATTPAQ